MIELVIGKEDGTIDNASIPVRWCIDPNTLDKIKDIPNVKVMIQVHYDGHTEDRFLVKLSNYMTYVPCRRSGEIEISAYLVRAVSGKRSTNFALKQVLLKRCGASKYTHDIDLGDKVGSQFYVDYDNNDDSYVEILSKVESPHKINIPKNVFGKELPKWFDKIINRYLESKPVDQCHVRRRIISFFAVRVWFLMTELLIIELRLIGIYFVAVMLGFWRMDLSRMLSPLVDGSDKLGNILSEDLKFHSVEWVYSRGWENRVTKFSKLQQFIDKLLCILVIPTIPLVYAGYSCIIIYMLNGSLSEALVLPMLLHLIVVITASVLLGCVFMVYAGVRILGKLLEYWLGSVTLLKPIEYSPIYKFLMWVVDQALKIEKWFSDKSSTQELKKELLTCNGDASSVTTDIKKIPLKERSVNLIYLDIKNKICKPMTR